MIKIGMMIGDRYEVLEKIGTGGMSDVYKAKDHKLNRLVAIKVLKQEFSENANFVSKFRVEAQAAAGLMHPNIVNVYDVGEENGFHYIVMELVEGITLKKYIEKKSMLSVKEAVSIAIQVCMGIESAHNNHIIHRDIKPQNIIISKEGKVKVTDFGIAKAASSNTITSNVMGSVHYTSPEQARGGYSDEKSDIYSLGVTMFEMLTGRVPFNGETTVAIAIKHIQEDMPSPRQYVEDIPQCVEQIVLKCCQKSPDRRYQSMVDLVADLKQSLINPNGDFVQMSDPDEEGATRMMDLEERKEIKRTEKRETSGQKHSSSSQGGGKNRKSTNRDESLRLKKDERLRYVDDEDDIDDEDDDYDPKMEKITTILAIVAAVLIGCIILFLVGRSFGLLNFSGSKKDDDVEEETITEDVDQVEMIQVVGKTWDEAKVALIELGLTPVLERYEETDEVEEGLIMSASAQPGDMVDAGSEISMIVSAGPNAIDVPNVVNLSETEAKSTLENAGFAVNITEVSDASVAKGQVVSQSPEANSKAPKGSAVLLHVSKGMDDSKIRVPNVMGQTEEEARILLAEAGLSVGTVTEVNFDDVAYIDKVCFQSYSEGSFVEKDTPVDLRISLGPVAATYKYTEDIQAPTEDEAYQSDMEVHVMLFAEDGTSLLDTKTNSFPVATNYTGIKSARGTIKLIFVVTTGEITETDPETGEVHVIPGSTEEKIVTREVEFTQE